MSCCKGSSSRFDVGVKFGSLNHANLLPAKSFLVGCSLRHRFTSVGFSATTLKAAAKWTRPSSKALAKACMEGLEACANSPSTEVHADSYSRLSGKINLQLLSTFPKHELCGRVVMVRSDLYVSFNDGKIVDEQPIILALPTIKYLHDIGAKVVLISHWNPLKSYATGIDTRLIADSLSRHLGHKVDIASGLVGELVENQISLLEKKSILLLENLLLQKEETANDPDFSKRLVAKADYFVNDAFAILHRVLASTVGAARFTRARLAGLQLEKEFLPLVKIVDAPEPPFVAIVGGGKLADRIGVLQALVHKCDKIIITGRMGLTLLSMYTLNESSVHLSKDLKVSANLFKVAKARNVDLVLPIDVWCVEESDTYQNKHVFAALSVPKGWKAIDFGPASMARMTASLTSCKMVFWIGSFAFCNTNGISEGALLLAKLLKHSAGSASVIVAGIEPSLAVGMADATTVIGHVFPSCATIWKLLKGNNLPGIDALDDVPLKLSAWKKSFKNPSFPLTVDIGSGNGLFLLNMASKYQNSKNFLGIEMNKKLVDRCQAAVTNLELKNLHFVAANAITSFKHLVAEYLGAVVLVAIQCPNPDFNKNDKRKRMVQRPLVESIVEVLPRGGKIFLQSDIKAVICQMRSEFELYGEGKVDLDIEHHNESNCDDEGWLKSNPFNVPTDWERHVIARGGRMYRLMLAKVN